MMKPPVFTPQMPDSAYMSTGVTATAAQTPFFAGSTMDPGRASSGLPGHTISPAAPSALSKGTRLLLWSSFSCSFLGNADRVCRVVEHIQGVW